MDYVKAPLRLNMQRDTVGELHRALAAVDITVDEDDLARTRFGRSTRDAVMEFQRRLRLPPTGEVDVRTARELSRRAQAASEATEGPVFRVRGTVRDERDRPIGRRTVRLYEQTLAGEDLLGEKTTYDNGFYDFAYFAPMGKKKRKTDFNVVVKTFDENDQLVASSSVVFRPGSTTWVNFNAGERGYRGVSGLDQLVRAVRPPVEEAGVQLTDIKETDENRQVTYLVKAAQRSARDVMTLLIAEHLASQEGPTLTTEGWYAFLAQGLPSSLPGELLEASARFAHFDRLVTTAREGIVSMEPDLQRAALEKAVADNLVPQALADGIEAILTTLGEMRTAQMGTSPFIVGKTPLVDVLATTALDETQQRTIVDLVATHRGAADELWTAVEAVEGFDETLVADVRTTLDLGVITKNHLPFMEYVKTQYADPASPLSSNPDLARLDMDGWKDLITHAQTEAGPQVIPDNLDGEEGEELAEVYASVLLDRAEAAYPTVAVTARASGVLTQAEPIAAFVDANPTFDVRVVNIDRYVAELPTPTEEVFPDPTTAITELKGLQRTMRLTRKARHSAALYTAGLRSAGSIAALTPTQFREVATASGVTELDANFIYNSAELAYAGMLARFGEYAFAFAKGSPSAILGPDPNIDLSQAPTLATLFGTVDYCDCEHCNSVLSPAAYLVDVLRFLGLKPAEKAGQTARSVLFGRRPDLGGLKLSCDNTNTVLPHIDLVCEILEDAISPSGISHQSTLGSAELRAHPEYVDRDAYDDLNAARFPMTMPFDLWLAEGRRYLAHLQIERHELMETLRAPSGVTDSEIAAEYFSLSPAAAGLITTADPANQATFWGTAQPATTLTNVKAFLIACALEYDELIALLSTKWVNPPGPNSVVIQRPVDDCDLALQTLTNVDDAFLDRAHRFIRARRAMPWEPWELDLLLRAPTVGAGQLDANALANLWKFRRLQSRLSLGTEEVLAFYGDLNVEVRVTPKGDELPLYHRLFLNRTVTNPTNPQFELAAIATVPPEPIAAHTETVLAGASIVHSDLYLLTPADGNLTIPNLSAIIRGATLARVLRVPVPDLLRLVHARSGSSPFADLDETWTFLDDADVLGSTGTTGEELRYLLSFTPQSPIGMSEPLVVQRITSLRNALAAVENDLSASDDELSELVARRLQTLATFGDTQTVATAVRIIDGSWSTASSEAPALSEAERVAFITERFAAFVDPALAGAQLGALAQPAGPARDAEILVRFQWVRARLRDHLSASAVKEQVATAFGLADDQATALLTSIELPGIAGTTLLGHLLDPALTATDPTTKAFTNAVTAAALPRFFDVMALLHKAALVVTELAIAPEDLRWLMEHRNVGGLLDLGALPVAAAAAVPFSAWRNLAQLLEFASRFPRPAEKNLFDIVAQAAAGEAQQSILDDLAALTGWDRQDLDDLAVRLALGQPAAFTEAATYERLGDAFALSRRGGVSATVLEGWAGVGIDSAKATEIREAVKSKYSSDEWLNVSTSIQDDIRELKRVALVEYLVAHPRDRDPADPTRGKAWDDVNGLFAYFLVDVEMTACFLTSRLRQAMSSVQLFVQRCLLNLERDDVVAHPNQGWDQWKWMKTYRVWEANRKVFLYPENWIEPELRDDKTPFFQQLENEILQDEITDANVERALETYLDSLDAVGRLEVVGVYHHFEPGVDDLIVLARTRGLPHKYHHRRFVANAHWTPWEEIDIEIEAEQVIPCIIDRKLHLFWLEFARRPVPKNTLPPTPAALPNPGQGSTPAPEPPEYLEIQLAWTALSQSAWSGKRLGKRKLIHPWLRPTFSYHLRGRPDGLGRLNLDVHLNSSIEFNNTAFYEPVSATWKLLTDTRFDENEWPWHSSTFVFDGDVVEVRLNNINQSQTAIRNTYGEAGREILPITFGQKRPRLRLPALMTYQHGKVVHQQANASQVNVLVATPQRIDSGQLLTRAPRPFALVEPHQSLEFDSGTRPFFYQDQQRAWFVRPQREWQSGWSFTTVEPSDSATPYRVRYTFHPFYHPYIRMLRRQLDRGGVEALLDRDVQLNPAAAYPGSTFAFDSAYSPSPLVAPVTQREELDFAYAGAYSQYNWELFFHAPLLIADRLRQNQRFEEALRWFKFIFDPTSPSADPIPKRYWNTKPFHEFNTDTYQQQRIENLLKLVNQGSVAYTQQVNDWRANPFKPHLVARLRPVAYQRTVVMKFIDNLIEWGDQLFRRDSIESINEATQLYVLAAEILGERPTQVPAATRAADKTFDELLPELDAFANAMAEVENTLGLPVQVVATPASGGPPLPPPEAFYFCIPHNERLLGYWDTVADRLFKIRHCMNIEGVVRQLALFDPPIDPALLVKAAAAGVDLGSVLDEIGVAPPHYRFMFMIPRAQQFAGEVRVLGAELLAALEKRDAERLALLRAGQEMTVAEAMLEVRRQQIEDAENAVKALEKSREVVGVRQAYYSSREFVNVGESLALALQGFSAAGEGTISTLSALAGVLGAIPNFSIGIAGFGGSPNVSISFGGGNLAAVLSGAAAAMSSDLRGLDKSAAMLNAVGSYLRRSDEWKYQLDLAEKELEQLDVEIAGANLRVELANREFAAQQRQLDSAAALHEQMRTKYTNAELYDWMVSQVSSLYFQAYQLAYDVAKRAERAFRYELGVPDSSYIRFGYWDSLKKGLLAGEKLSVDLMKLEAGYIDRNRRELELVKHVSLAEVAPVAFLQLKETGSCTVDLPELLFDLDYPGHYFRRLKSVGVSVPCVTGPYAGVHCTLTLLRNSVRTTAVAGAAYPRTGLDDSRFRDQIAAVQSIATSTGQDDTGMFVHDFRDERYLPFEGAGAISRWLIQMPRDANQFDFATVADVVLHLRYTARDGGQALAGPARQAVAAALPTTGARLLDVKREFPDAWHAFTHPQPAGSEQVLTLRLGSEHFPFFARGRTITVSRVDMVAELGAATAYDVSAVPIDPVAPFQLTRDGQFGPTAHHVAKDAGGAAWPLGDWTIRIKRQGVNNFTSLPQGDVLELFLVLHYSYA